MVLRSSGRDCDNIVLYADVDIAKQATGMEVSDCIDVKPATSIGESSGSKQ